MVLNGWFVDLLLYINLYAQFVFQIVRQQLVYIR